MRKNKLIFLMVSLLVVFSLFLGACAKTETGSDPAPADEKEPAETPNTETKEPEAEGPKYGGDLIWGTTGSPTLFNPLWSSDTASSSIENLVFDGLLGANESFEPYPSMAERWEISDDSLTWTFYLKKGIKWHDGEEFTAKDVVFTFSIPKDPDYDGPRASSFEDLEGVTAIDDYTVEFTLSRPNARFIWTAGSEILPEHILGDVPIAELGEHEFNYNPIGTGPFKFDEWVDGQYVRVTAFDDYFLGRPYLDSITYKIVPDQNSLLAQLQAGDIQKMGIPASDVSTAKEWEEQGKIKLSSTLALQYNWLGYNLREELFQDVNVRRAITHAIDRQAIIDAVVNGEGQIAHAPASPLSWAYNPNTPQFNYDPEKAKKLLEEAGWVPGSDGILEKDGERFSFTIKTNQGNKVREDIVVVIQQFLKEVGIEAIPQIVEFSALLQQIDPPNWDFEALVLGWNLSVDPDPTAIWHTKEIELGLNNIAYSRPDLDELMDLNTTILDLEERKKVVWQIFDEIANDQPYTFLYYPNAYQALPPFMEGFTHHPSNEQYKANEWWFDN